MSKELYYLKRMDDIVLYLSNHIHMLHNYHNASSSCCQEQSYAIKAYQMLSGTLKCDKRNLGDIKVIYPSLGLIMIQKCHDYNNLGDIDISGVMLDVSQTQFLALNLVQFLAQFLLKFLALFQVLYLALRWMLSRCNSWLFTWHYVGCFSFRNSWCNSCC